MTAVFLEERDALLDVEAHFAENLTGKFEVVLAVRFPRLLAIASFRSCKFLSEVVPARVPCGHFFRLTETECSVVTELYASVCGKAIFLSVHANFNCAHTWVAAQSDHFSGLLISLYRALVKSPVFLGFCQVLGAGP